MPHDNIENEIFTLEINDVEGWFSIEPKDKILPGIEHAFLGLRYRFDKKWENAKFLDWQEIPGSRQVNDFGVHGKAEMINYEVKTTDGLVVTFHFGIVLETPLVVWKVEVLNDRQQVVWLEKIDLLKVKESAGGKVNYPEAVKSSELGFYSNGWQSWSPTGWYAGDGKMKVSKLRGLQTPMINNPGTPMPKMKGQFSSDMFAVVGDRIARTGFVVGF